MAEIVYTPGRASITQPPSVTMRCLVRKPSETGGRHMVDEVICGKPVVDNQCYCPIHLELQIKYFEDVVVSHKLYDLYSAQATLASLRGESIKELNQKMDVLHTRKRDGLAPQNQSKVVLRDFGRD